MPTSIDIPDEAHLREIEVWLMEAASPLAALAAEFCFAFGRIFGRADERGF
jgi:hypothetical protein